MLSKQKLFEIVFKTDSKAGKNFDVALLWIILASVTVVILDSIESLGENYRLLFDVIEWSFTLLFTLEYLLRIYISPQPKKYILSAWGVIDLISLIPTYLSLIFVGAHYLSILRLIRMLRIFRILR